MFFLRLFCVSLPLLSQLVIAQGYGHGVNSGRDGDDDGNDDGNVSSAATSTTSSQASTSTSTSTAAQASQVTVTGDTQCSSTMCIAATVNGTETTYVLTGLGKAQFGWMAMGFGSQMANTPMVIMWQNNGNVILSQRKASSEVMPTTDSSPPRTASALQAQSTISTTTPSLAYTIPSNTDVTQPIIFAYGTTDPGSADPTATLIQHLDYGTLTLNLQANVISSNGSSTGNTTTASDGSGGSLSIPLAPYEKLIIAHAILCTIGFLLLLPAGVLLARYMRTFVSNWFQGHWIVQFGIAGIVIIIGIALGIASVSQAHAVHLDDDHKKWGITLLVLYLVQCALGAFIHFVKKADRTRRPAQNYLHAVLGLATIGLALFQVHSGYDHEWVVSTGRDALPKSVSVVFWVWVVLLPVSYAVGLSFLPKQFRQERAKVNNSNGDDDRDHFNLRQTTYEYQKAVQ